VLLQSCFEFFKIDGTIIISINIVEDFFHLFPLFFSWLWESVFLAESNDGIVSLFLGDCPFSSRELLDNPVLNFLLLLFGKLWPLSLSLEEFSGLSSDLEFIFLWWWSVLLHGCFELFKVNGSIIIGVDIVEYFLHLFPLLFSW
jgi:hypothetical protein